MLSSLELELTMLESDEEPSVRPVDGRYVVTRIHCTPPPTVPTLFRDPGGSREAPTFRFISVRSVSNEQILRMQSKWRLQLMVPMVQG